MVMCWAFGCNHYSDRGAMCRFFRFPLKEKERNQWKQLLRRDTEPGPGAYVCSCHFPDGKRENGPELFAFNAKKRSSTKTRKKTLRLSLPSTPSVFTKLTVPVPASAMEAPSSSQASTSHSDLEAIAIPVKCEFPNEPTSTLQNHPIANHLFKEQRIFDCSYAIEPLRCLQCTKFETYKLVDLKRHFKAGHALLESEEQLYACGNCNFQTHSRYSILRHGILKTCIINRVKSEHGVPEVGELQFKEESLTDSDGVDPLNEKWLKCDDDTSLLENHCLESHRNLEYLPEDTTKQPKLEYCDVEIEEHDLLDDVKPSMDNLEYFQYDASTYKTESKSVLNHHAESGRKPGRKKSFKCEFCPYLATRSNGLKRHILYKHTDPDKIKWFQCEHCPYKCKGICDLKSHVDRKHGKNVKFKCDRCEFEIKSKQGLHYHVLTRHTDPRWFHCEHCPYKTKRKCYLKTHFSYKHGNRAKIKCEHCQFQTKFKQSLKNHVLLKHTDRVPAEWFACDHCPYKCKRKFDLKTHMDYEHGNKAKLKCDHCEFETKFKNSLKSHISIKHTDPDRSRALRCAHCPYMSANSSTLKRHVLVKHADPNNIEWFHCEHCSYQSRVKAYLENHILMRHQPV